MPVSLNTDYFTSINSKSLLYKNTLRIMVKIMGKVINLKSEKKLAEIETLNENSWVKNTLLRLQTSEFLVLYIYEVIQVSGEQIC